MPLDLVPDNHMLWWLSAVVAATTVVVLGCAFGLGIRELLRLRREQRNADSLLDEAAPLRLGLQHVAGVVELEPDVEFAARVEIRQVGTEAQNGKYSWREESRKSFCNSFWIQHASGERVYVEPPKKLNLIGLLNGTVHDEPLVRYRIAELSKGEKVVAEGKLEQMPDPAGSAGYREAEQLWVLKPTTGERLRFSTGSISERHRRRSRRLSRSLMFLCVPLMAGACALMSPYFARALFGQEEVAVVERAEHYTSQPAVYNGQNDQSVEHYDVFFVDEAGRHLAESLDDDDYDDVTTGDRLVLLVVPGWPGAWSLGSRPTLGESGLAALLLALAALGVTLFAMRPEWYNGGKWNESSAGALPPPDNTHVYSRN